MSFAGKLLDRNHYVRVLKRHLPQEIFRPAPTRLVWMAPHVLVVTISAFAISAWSLPIWLNLLLALVIGCSFSALGFLGHEILHGAVVRKPWLRDLLGAICMSPFCLSPRLWRKWHNAEHHGHTQDPGRDPDMAATLEDYRKKRPLQLLFRFPPWMQGIMLFASFTFWFSRQSLAKLLEYSARERPRERVIMYGQALIPFLFWIVLATVVGLGNLLFIFLIPLLIANFLVMSYISTNHLLSPLTAVNDPLANSLTVLVPRAVAILHLNFGFHTEHHIFPSMSARYAPLVMKLCRRLWPDRYHGMSLRRALVLLFRTPRLYKDETTLVDPRRNRMVGVLGYGLG
ncbi:MAG: fatty acid desaturase [Parcubacteria group bacterium]|nr:fatty acid desaturase [Parcubacteria group bacterium]